MEKPKVEADPSDQAHADVCNRASRERFQLVLKLEN